MVGVVAHQVNLENTVGSLGRERGRLTVTKEEGPGAAAGSGCGHHGPAGGGAQGRGNNPAAKPVRRAQTCRHQQFFAFRHVKMQLPETQGSLSLLGFG